MLSEQLQQLVPSEWCFACRKCCRFPGTDDVQSPVFSTQELRDAIDRGGAKPAWFQPNAQPPSHDVVLVNVGDECHCPALESSRHECRIYAHRPLDCRIYPFVVAQDPSGSRAVLGIDTQCPYTQQIGPSVLRDYALYLAALLESPEGRKMLQENPGLADRMRESFLYAYPLTRSTITQASPPLPACELVESPEAPIWKKITKSKQILSAYHPAIWWPWQRSGTMQLWSSKIAGVDCLAFRQGDELALALPPLQEPLSELVIDEAFRILGQLSGAATAAVRIENISQGQARQMSGWGYDLYEVEREYLYRRNDLLAASPACSGASFRPFQPQDAETCFRLHLLWSLRKQLASTSQEAKMLLRDGLYLHQGWLHSSRELGVTGCVAEMAGEIKGYTLGVQVDPEMFLILAESTDTETPQLAQELQQQFLSTLPHTLINTMGDAGLDSLAQVKIRAKPHQVLPVYAAKPRPA